MGIYKNNSGTLDPIAGVPANILNSKQNKTDNTLETTAKTIPGAINEVNEVVDIVHTSTDEYSSSVGYKVGDYVIHDNTLYRCKTACSAASWSTNQSNFESTTLTKAVTNLNASLTTQTGTITSNHAINATYTHARKLGKIVDIAINITTSSTIAQYGEIAMVPDGFRPSAAIFCMGMKGTSAEYFYINTSGKVSSNSSISSGTNIVINISYVLD